MLRFPKGFLAFRQNDAGTVAPLAPAPGSNAQIITTPQTFNSVPLSNVEQASAAARAAIAAGQPIIPPAPGEGQPRVPAGRPEGGEFAPDPRRELPGGKPDDSTDRTPRAPGEEREVPDAPGVAPKPGEAAPDDEGGNGEGTDSHDDAALEELAVVIPAIGDGEEDLHIELEDKAAAGRLREIVSQVSQVEQREQAILADFDEIDRVRESVVADPVGYAMTVLGNDPAALDHLVLGTLTRPDVLARLGPKIQKMLADPNELRVVTSEQKGVRAEYRDLATQRIQENREVRENLNQIQQAIASVIPENLDQARAAVVFSDMLRDVQEYANRYDRLTIPVTDLPMLLARRLSALGIEPQDAAQRMTKAAMRRAPRGRSPLAGRAPVASNGNGTNGGAPARAAGKPDGKAFVASSDRRRAAGGIPAAGAGAPAGGHADLAPPTDKDGKPLGIEDTIKWHRARLKKNVRAY